MELVPLLRSLSEASGVSGYEDEVRALVREAFSAWSDEVRSDAMGNVIALKRGSGEMEPRRRIMLAGHMDEIGLIVTALEKGGYVAHLRTIFDDTNRPMLFINWNTDMGDGWEWSNAEDYPGYVKYTSMAYRMGINEVVYALTH